MFPYKLLGLSFEICFRYPYWFALYFCDFHEEINQQFLQIWQMWPRFFKECCLTVLNLKQVSLICRVSRIAVPEMRNNFLLRFMFFLEVLSYLVCCFIVNRLDCPSHWIQFALVFCLIGGFDWYSVFVYFFCWFQVVRYSVGPFCIFTDRSVPVVVFVLAFEVSIPLRFESRIYILLVSIRSIFYNPFFSASTINYSRHFASFQLASWICLFLVWLTLLHPLWLY